MNTKLRISILQFVSFFLFFISTTLAQNLNNGLIAYYPLDVDANDYSGNNYNATLLNSPSFNPGVKDKGVQIYGTNEFPNGGGSCIILPPSLNTVLNSLNQFTISLWVNEQSMISYGGEGYFFIGNHNTGWLGISHFYDPSSNSQKLNFSVGANGFYNPSPILLPFNDSLRNKFVHYLITYNNGVLKAYMNANLVGQLNQSIVLQSNNGGLGRHWWGDNNDYSTVLRGLIDEVKIYDRSLTQTEITQLYDLDKPNLNTGLVAFYPFNGNANDESGNNNNGTIEGATLTTDRFSNENKAFNFNGVNNRVIIPFNSNLYNPEISISTWVKFNELNGTYQCLIIANNDGWAGFALIFENNKLQWLDYNGYYYNASIEVPLINLNTSDWYNFVIVRSLSDLKLYRNGELIGSQSNLSPYNRPTSSPIAIGSHSFSISDHPFNGKMDDTRIYGRLLTQSEIIQLYQNESFLTLKSPIGGETIYKGNTYSIKWNSNIQSVKIELSTNNGNSWSVIIPNTPAISNTYQWNVPNITSNQCKIRISDADNVSLSSISSSTFSITDLLLSNGLVVYYPFDNNFNDATGNGYNGIADGNPTFIPGVVGKAVKFTGDSPSNCTYYAGGDRIRMPLINFNSMPSFTISFWVNDSLINCGAETYFFQGDDNGGSSIQMWHHFSNLIFSVGAPAQILVVPYREEDKNKFVLYTMTYENGVMKAYRNLELLGSLNQSVSYSNSYAGIATHFWSPSNTSARFTGKIDDFRIYNRAITSSEIQQLYTQNKYLTLIQPNGGEVFPPSSTQTISWSSNGIANIKLELTTNNGINWSIINSSILASTGNYPWLVPNISSTQCKIRISDTDNPNINSISQTVFNIAQPNISSGLVAYYPFNGNANDASGNNNNGSVNGATLTTDRFGNQNKAYYFNGVNNSIIVNDNNTLDFTNKFTISGWFKTDEDLSDMCIVGKGRDVALSGYNILIKNDKLLSVGINNNYNSVLSSDLHPQVGSWYFFCATYGNDELKIFINGNLNSNQFENLILLNSSQPLNIGRETSGLGRYFKGAIDDIRLYNRALTDNEVQLLYNTTPNISVNWPYANAQWFVNSTEYIQWQSNQISNIKIEYLYNNNLPWKYLTTQTASNNAFAWTISNTFNSGEYKLKLSDNNNPNIFAISDNFIINNLNNQGELIKFKFGDPGNEIKKIKLHSQKYSNINDLEFPTLLFRREISKQIINKECSFSREELAVLFPAEESKTDILELFDVNDNLLGHIYFNFSKTDFAINKKVDAILYLETKTAGQLTSYNSDWNYFPNSNERLVYMLIPPNESFSSIRYDVQPLLFVHGIYGKYPTWNLIPKQTYTTFDGWQLYYPYDMRISDCSNILKEAIDNVLFGITGISVPYLFSKINIVAHSMGGLVTRHYIQNTNIDRINKLLMLGTPNNGSLSSLVAHDELHGVTGALADFIKDRNSPAHIDMSPASKFLKDLDVLQMKPLYGADILKSYLVISGTKHIWYLTPAHYEAYQHDDGVVAVSSASLLNKQIPLATIKLNHTELPSQISPSLITSFFNDNYNPVSGNYWLNLVKNEVDGFYLDYNNPLKIDNNSEFEKNKGLLYLSIDGIDQNKHLLIVHDVDNKYNVEIRSVFIGTPYLDHNPETNIFFLRKMRTDALGGIGNNFGTNSFLSFTFKKINLIHNKDIKQIFFNFSPMRTNWFYESSSLRNINFSDAEQFLINSNSTLPELTTIGNKQSTFQNKNLSSQEKTFYVDSSIDTVAFYLCGLPGDTAFTNSNFKLLDPNNNIIDSNSNNLNIKYKRNLNNSFEYYYILNPLHGNWKAQYNSNIFNPYLSVSVNGDFALNIKSVDSINYLGDSIKFYIQIPNVSKLSSIQFVTKNYFKYTNSDSIHFWGQVNITSINDSTYIGKFLPLNSGEYQTEIDFNCVQNGQNITRKFTFISSVSELKTPVNLYPKNDSTSISQTTNIIWSKVSNSTKYKLEVYKLGNLLPDFSFNDLTDSVYNISGLLKETSYKWRVRSINNNDSSLWSNFSSFKTIVNAPISPSLASPPDSTGGLMTSLVFNWNNGNNVLSYNLIISLDTTFQNIIFNDSTIVDTSKTVSGLSGNTRYYWKVRAKNEGGTGLYSNFRNFRTIGLPTTSTSIQPLNSSFNQPVTQAFRWTKSFDQTDVLKNSNNINNRYDKKIKVEKTRNQNTKNKSSSNGSEYDYVSKYLFELTSDTNSVLNRTSDSTLTDTVKVVANLLHSHKYYWRVKGQNEAGWGNFSNWNSFNTINYPYLVSNSAPNVGANSSTIFGITDIVFNANVTTSSNVTLSYFTVAPVVGNLPSGVNFISNYYWHFQDSGIVFSSGIIKIPLSSLAGITDSSTLHWMKRSFAGDDWTDLGGTVINGFFVSTIPFDSFSEFAIGSTNDQPLTSSYFNIKFIPSGLYNTSTGNLNMRDTVRAYLIDITSPTTIIDSSLGIIDSVNFTALFDFKKAPTGTYFIKIKHRNSLETWSKVGGESFTKFNTMIYDFTDAQNKSYGNNSILVNSLWCMLTGDIDHDGYINGNDFTVFSQQYGLSGYLTADLNGDGVVNGNDFTYFSQSYGRQALFPNAILVKPTTTKRNFEKSTKQNFIKK